jgi:hypothetical protein
MKRRITRRQVLAWFLGGAAFVVAAWQIPTGRMKRKSVKPRSDGASVSIPTRPFDRADLHRNHDLAG